MKYIGRNRLYEIKYNMNAGRNFRLKLSTVYLRTNIISDTVRSKFYFGEKVKIQFYRQDNTIMYGFVTETLTLTFS